MDEDISAVTASLHWSVPKIRRAGGAREGGFIGADVTLAELASGSTQCRIGVTAPKGVPPRSGTPIFDSPAGGQHIGLVTSGSPAPSVGQPAAMVRIDRDFATGDAPVFAEVRGKRLPLTRCDMPFVAHRFYRGS